MLPQLKMIVVIIFILGLTCGGGQQIPPPEGNTLILMNVIDTLDSLSLQLKEFEEKVEAKFEEVQANVTGIIETQKTIQADIKQVQANVTGIIETQKTIQADIKLQETTLVAKIEVQETTLVAKIEEVQANVTGIIETQKTIQADIKRLQQCATEAQLSQFQELVFKDDCVEGSHTCGDMGTCTDYFNRYECSCLPGYSGDGITCQDVNECSENNNICGDHGTCHNNPGSYTCICDKNFRYVGNICQDIDECSENNNICGDHGTCRNEPGSYTCTCDKYFKLVGDICQGPVCESSNTSLFIPEIGCLTLLVREWMTWDESKSKCQEMGLRLAEGIQRRHFQALSDHFHPIIPEYSVAWIGFRHRQWLNEEEENKIQEEDWAEGQPNGDLEECGYIRLRPSYLGLGDGSCLGSTYPLCQSLP